MAMWMLNKTSINYLWACWRKRKSIVGTLQIKAGTLVRTKPDNVVQPGRLRQQTTFRHPMACADTGRPGYPKF